MLYITHKFLKIYIILFILNKKTYYDFFSLYIMISTSTQLYYLNILCQKYIYK
jgi:hypothetical protein